MTKPRTLLFDIETSPLQMYAWTTWKANSLWLTENVKLLSISWKWLGEKKTHFLGLPDFELYDEDPTDDYALAYHMRELLDEADVVIAHNGDRFDTRRTNARLIFHELLPPSPYVTIDTLKIARRHFAFDSNRLNDLADYLGIGRKVQHTGVSLWKACMEGDPEAWKLMKKYNLHDTDLLEGVYLKLRPWIEGHPNNGLFNYEQMVCANCGSEDVQQRGYKYTKTRRYKQYVCKECGAWNRSRLCDKEGQPHLTN